jgi:extracellular elastinolytic metalloproteinase
MWIYMMVSDVWFLYQGHIARVVNFKAKSSYRVLPLSSIDPTNGGFKVLKNPEHLNISPLGWHHDGNQSYTITKGNNVISGHYQEPSFSDVISVEGGKNLDFVNEWDPAADPKLESNVNASITNLFYSKHAFLIKSRQHDA